MKKAVLFMLVLISLSALARGGGSDRADVEHAVQQYFQAISLGNGRLLCERIDPKLGFFASEQNCLDWQAYSEQHGYGLGPHYSEDIPFQPEPTITKINDIQVSGDNASLTATVSWDAAHSGEQRAFGSAQLPVRLMKEAGSWRIAGFDSSAKSDGQGDAAAVAQVVLSYYVALGQQTGYDRQTSFWSSSPTQLGEHRERDVLSSVQSVEFKGEYAAASIDTYVVDNGAIGHPVNGKLVLRRQGEAWTVVPATDSAYALFQ